MADERQARKGIAELLAEFGIRKRAASGELSVELIDLSLLVTQGRLPSFQSLFERVESPPQCGDQVIFRLLAWRWRWVRPGPVGFLDGGGAFRGMVDAWHRPAIRYENGVPVEASAPERSRAVQIAVLYGLLAASLVACAVATRHSAAF